MKLKGLLLRSGPTLVLVGLIVAAFVIRKMSPDDQRLRRALVLPGVKDDSFSRDASSLLTQLFGLKNAYGWQVNSIADKRKSSIYLYRGSQLPPEWKKDYQFQIAWVAESHMVVVDTEYLSTLAARLTDLRDNPRFNPQDLAQAKSNAAHTFLIWVLGHELGHSFFGDGSRHFRVNDLEKLADDDAKSREIEERADHFLSDHISAFPVQQQLVESQLVTIVSREVEARTPFTGVYGPSIGLFSHDQIDTLSEGSHPEFVIRAATMLSSITTGDQTYPDLARRTLARIKATVSTDCTLDLRITPSGGMLEFSRDRVATRYLSPAHIVVPNGRYSIAAGSYSATTGEILGRKQFTITADHCPRIIERDLVTQ